MLSLGIPKRISHGPSLERVHSVSKGIIIYYAKNGKEKLVLGPEVA